MPAIRTDEKEERGVFRTVSFNFFFFSFLPLLEKERQQSKRVFCYLGHVWRKSAISREKRGKYMESAWKNKLPGNIEAKGLFLSVKVASFVLCC